MTDDDTFKWDDEFTSQVQGWGDMALLTSIANTMAVETDDTNTRMLAIMEAERERRGLTMDALED